MTSKIAKREEVLTTPYFRLVGKHLADAPPQDPFYALELPDYVSIVARTAKGEIVLVKQYRPAVETVTLELPAGLVDPGGTPDQTAIRELKEETGFIADRVTLVGCLKPDTGRLGNRLWVYFAPDVLRDRTAAPESGMEVVIQTPAQLTCALADGTFDHALHVAALLLAVQLGHLTLS
ncbi:MAG TPA: NUDIX hydrolase [Vicinamibacterales bacterium]|nr:NUDIX hydrolase [Vicinamibacterales bacterium]